MASKLEHCHGSSFHMRKMLYNSLMWKLAAFFLIDWFDGAYNVAAIPSVSSSEDEETRQRLKVLYISMLLSQHCQNGCLISNKQFRVMLRNQASAC